MYYKKIEFSNGFMMQYTNIPDEILGWTQYRYNEATYDTKYEKNRPCEIWTIGNAFCIFDRQIVSDIERELETIKQQPTEYIYYNGIKYRAVNSEKLKKLKKETTELINITLQRLEIAKKYHNEMIIERR